MHVFTVFIVKLVMASTFSFSAQRVNNVPPPRPPESAPTSPREVPPPAPPTDATTDE